MGGATRKHTTKNSQDLFQSTRPWGARLGGESNRYTQVMFQSTRPWGARQRDNSLRDFRNRFNPRARGGRDGYASAYIARKKRVSIHAPVGGATLGLGYTVPVGEFQSTRPWGARHELRSPCESGCVGFNPRARGGRDNIDL